MSSAPKKSFFAPEKAAAARILDSVGRVILLGCIVAIGVAAYRTADENGWFAHKRIVSVSMSRNWIRGEFKPCRLSGDDLVCDSDAEQHQMEVEFRGLVESDKWTCQFKESILCKADSTARKQEKPDTWFVRNPATHQATERSFTLNEAIDFCKDNPKMEIATEFNASKDAFTICPAFLGEFSLRTR